MFSMLEVAFLKQEGGLLNLLTILSLTCLKMRACVLFSGESNQPLGLPELGFNHQ